MDQQNHKPAKRGAWETFLIITGFHKDPIRYRRLRQFFFVSFIIHVLFLISLWRIEPWRRFLLGLDTIERGQIDPSVAKFQEAMDTLLRINRDRLIETATDLAKIRDDLNALQVKKLKRMRDEDDSRKKRIEEGTYPDPNAVFFRRIDVDPPPLAFAPLPPEKELANKNIVDLYNLHVPLEAEAAKAYERYRALELAENLTDPIPVSKTLQVTTLVLPRRKEPNMKVLDLQIENIGEGRRLRHFKVYRRELTELFLEAENMVATATRWLELATKLESGLAGHFGEQYDMIPKPTPYYGHYLNPKLLRRVELRRAISPEVVLGNRVTNDLKAEWMSIDKWYVNGPWTHPGEQRRLSQLNRKYPPESFPVQLDLVYKGMGKGGRTLQWKYRRMGSDFLAGGVRCEPYVVDNDKYAVWYFYSEIYSDDDKLLLASFASDDYGVCWLNEEKVYHSPPECQPWVPFTANSFRALKLRKGINRILFKLENALGTTGFSIILMTHPDPELTSMVQQGGSS